MRQQSHHGVFQDCGAHRTTRFYNAIVGLCHGGPMCPPHQWIPRHLPCKAHSGALPGHYRAVYFMASPLEGSPLWDCCWQCEDTPGDECSRPDYMCRNCNRLLKNLDDTDKNCLNECMICGVQEESCPSPRSHTCEFRESFLEGECQDVHAKAGLQSAGDC
eukprot:TRINITY_DN106000_c0_g1_i1.p1 TRINITY_DN106000_c0_g1~~TRINITY_DN106000_c0_g1_i1.p1  ORF type:complete len:161 (-),score=7.50 TRINITY_DN106000_c0_g1_i1:164-646(-)